MIIIINQFETIALFELLAIEFKVFPIMAL